MRYAGVLLTIALAGYVAGDATQDSKQREIPSVPPLPPLPEHAHHQVFRAEHDHVPEKYNDHQEFRPFHPGVHNDPEGNGANEAWRKPDLNRVTMPTLSDSSVSDIPEIPRVSFAQLEIPNDMMHIARADMPYPILIPASVTKGQRNTATIVHDVNSITVAATFTDVHPTAGVMTMHCEGCPQFGTIYFQKDLKGHFLTETIVYGDQTAILVGTIHQTPPRSTTEKRPAEVSRVTVSILNKQHGQTTLNSPPASDIDVVFTHVTLVDVGSGLATLTESVDAQGHTVIETIPPATGTVATTQHSSPLSSATVHPTVHTGGTDTASANTSAASQSSHVLSSSTRISLTTLTATVTSVTFVTQTIFPSQDSRCLPNILNVFTATQTVAVVDGTEFPITSTTQRRGRHTTLILQPTPEAILQKFGPNLFDVMDLISNMGTDHETDVALKDLSELYSHIDMNAIRAIAAWISAADSAVGPVNASKEAMTLSAQRKNTRSTTLPTPGPVEAIVKVGKIATSTITVTAPTTLHVNHTDWTFSYDPGRTVYDVANQIAANQAVALTSPTQTLPGGLVIVVSPPPNGSRTKVFPEYTGMPNCDRGESQYQCRYENCMWEFWKPINITTVFPAVMHDQLNHPRPVFAWFTQSTSIVGRSHWGTTHESHTYYPLRTSSTMTMGTVKTFFVRETPETMSWTHKVEGAPVCDDGETCDIFCKAAAHDPLKYAPRRVLFAVGVGLGTLVFLLVLFALCTCWVRRHRQKKSQGLSRPKDGASTPTPLATNAPGLSMTTRPSPEVMMTPARNNSQTSATRGHQRAGTTATTTGRDAGAAETGDGRGTLSRRAEEGRGNVPFFTRRSNSGGERIVVMRTDQPAPAAAREGGDAVPTHRFDGAGDAYSGKEPIDKGSVRGRQLSRLEEQSND